MLSYWLVWLLGEKVWASCTFVRSQESAQGRGVVPTVCVKWVVKARWQVETNIATFVLDGSLCVYICWELQSCSDKVILIVNYYWASLSTTVLSFVDLLLLWIWARGTLPDLAVVVWSLRHEVWRKWWIGDLPKSERIGRWYLLKSSLSLTRTELWTLLRYCGRRVVSFGTLLGWNCIAFCWVFLQWENNKTKH